MLVYKFWKLEISLPGLHGSLLGFQEMKDECMVYDLMTKESLVNVLFINYLSAPAIL